MRELNDTLSRIRGALPDRDAVLRAAVEGGLPADVTVEDYVRGHLGEGALAALHQAALVVGEGLDEWPERDTGEWGALVVALSGWFGALDEVGLAALLAVRVFHDPIVPLSERLEVVMRATDVGAEALLRRLQDLSAVVGAVKVTHRYWPRPNGYLMGGPPQMVLEGWALKHVGLRAALDEAIDAVPSVHALLLRLLKGYLWGNEARLSKATEPDVLDFLDRRDRSVKDDERSRNRALSGVTDNYALLGAAECLARHPDLLSDPVLGRALTRLLESGVEKIQYVLLIRLGPVFSKCPSAIQKAMLDAAIERGPQWNSTTDGAVLLLLLNHLDETEVRRYEAEVRLAITTTVQRGHEEALSPLIDRIREGFTGEGWRPALLEGLALPTVQTLVGHQDPWRRALAADLWFRDPEAISSGRPELARLYQRLQADTHETVQQSMAQGFRATVLDSW